jgi:GNAT superfamily N-acetyltransferase
VTIRARDWQPADLPHLQSVVAARWSVFGPRAGWHIGDMAWWVSMWEWPTPDGPSGRRRLWFDETTGQPVAWAWATPPAELDFAVHPERDGDGLHEQVLGWAHEQLTEIKASALDSDEPSVRALEAAGLERGEEHLYHLAVHLADPPAPPPPVPPGYAVRPVAGEEELPARVEVHRTVWQPSSVTLTSYRQVTATWPYRPELDWVAVAPDGSFAASALGWLDATNASVQLEPVGTHPGHQRLGLGRAVCDAVLRTGRRLGASVGVVACEPGGAAQALYESVGFRRVATRYRWRTRPAA